ncbi:MAG: hypothetical protein JWR26_3723 [Pedosphaera sp.]|nr:hypothetical protein [Pedosphaera sp.]
MIDQLLQSHLEPVARGYRRSQLWRLLAKCWAATALVGLAAILVRHFSGWSAPLIFPLLLVASLIAAGVLAYRFRKSPPDYREIVRQIEAENPQLHSLLLTAVEQQPQTPSGSLNYLQQRVIAEALEHHQKSAWGKRTAKSLFAAQCAHWVAFALFVVILINLRPSISHGKDLWARAEQSNGVTVTPGDTSIERGNGLVVLARFTGKLPADAELVVNPVNENERRIPLAKNLNDPVFGGGIPEIKGDLQYHIEFSAGRTRDFKVSTFDFPRLERADARVSFPSYTGLPEKTIPDTRRVSAIEGSSLDYSFFLNKPVVNAKLVAKDKTVVPLIGDTNNPSIYHAQFKLDQSKRYELLLVDDAGRTNKLPPEFVLEALKNRPAELKIASPRGDQRVSPLEEISFQAEASADFGLKSYGIAYTLAGGETKMVELGRDSKAQEKRQFKYLLPLESLDAKPEQLLSYYVWADNAGPDGKTRRTSSDMFFAEIRPFDEIFREGQSPDGANSSNPQSGQQNGGQAEQLAELQRQITSATWNLQRNETGAKPSDKFKENVTVVENSQKQALQQLRTLKEKTDDSKLKTFAEQAEKAMVKASQNLGESADKNSVAPLPSALSEEQSASQALLNLQAREFQVTQSNRNQQGNQARSQRQQRQLDQLDVKQAENRYETQKEASPAQTPQQREQLQVANRLKELAQRQQDLNGRLKELQNALQEAKTEKEREEIRDRLKRLREEQQDMLADVDELRQRMDRPENQSRMAEARQQLEQTRSEVQKAAEALKQESASQALASGTRAERELKQLQDDFRRKNSSEFAEDMRQMRDKARQLDQNQQDIAKKLTEKSEQKTLNDSEERKELASQLEQQKSGLTNLLTEMKTVSEQSETAEPLLSRQLYDMLRRTSQDDVDKALDSFAELVRRGFVPQAGQFEQHARENIDNLKQGVERAAESVLGDGTEALRLAKRELEGLDEQVAQELGRGGQVRGTNAPGRDPGNTPGQQASAQNPGSAEGQEPSDSPGKGQQARAGDNQSKQAGGQQPGDAEKGSSRGDPQQTASARQGKGGGNNQAQSPQRGGGQPGALPDALDQNNNGGGQGGGSQGPLFGDDYVDWSDRLRNVEEMIDVPGLQTEVARIRDRAHAMRMDFKHTGKKPDWAVVRTQISEPLAEVRSRVDEELMRRQSKDALVPLDRDPVPSQFSELVRRYYEKLGKSD